MTTVGVMQSFAGDIVGADAFDNQPSLPGSSGEIDYVLALRCSRKGSPIEDNDRIFLSVPDVKSGPQEYVYHEVVLAVGILNQFGREKCVPDRVLA